MPGNQVKDWDKYHALVRKGYSKSSAAKIANSQAKKSKRSPASKRRRRKKRGRRIIRRRGR